MALKISREVPLGAGSRGFRFENHADSVEDRKQYEEGRTLEEERLQKGTLAQKVFFLLSNPAASQHEARSARVVAPVVARRTVRRKARKSAA